LWLRELADLKLAAVQVLQQLWKFSQKLFPERSRREQFA